MKLVHRTEGTLVLRDSPWLVWVVGVAFIGGGLFAFVSNEKLFGGGFVLAGAVLILGFANTVTSEFNRTTGRFRSSTRGILRSSETFLPLADIVDVRVDASASGNPSRAHRIVLGLKAGKDFPLTSSYSSGKADKERLAAEVREFLDIQEGPRMPGFREMVGMMFDPNAAERLQELNDRMKR